MCDLRCTDWHCVLVPGYDFGWVQEVDVVEIRAWIPPDASLTSSLKKLTLCLLSVIGGTLEGLCLDNSCSSGNALEEVVLECPNLKSASALVEKCSQETRSNESALKSLTIDWKRSNVAVLLDILTIWTAKNA